MHRTCDGYVVSGFYEGQMKISENQCDVKATERVETEFEKVCVLRSLRRRRRGLLVVVSSEDGPTGT